MNLQTINEYFQSTNKLLEIRRNQGNVYVKSIVIPLLDKNKGNYSKITEILDITFNNKADEIIDYHLRKLYLSPELFEDWKQRCHKL